MTTNLTRGRVTGPLIRFTIPLILGNIFQLTYNAVDSIMVGRYIGKQALAAVGTAGPVMNIITFLVVGACLGAGVLMSEYFGAGDEEKLRYEVGTTLTAGLLFTVALSGLCAALAPQILRLTRVSEELLPEASAYLRIICIALSFTFLYNLFASALRAVGDAKSPLLFLATSCVLNIFMDYVTIVHFHMGVEGAALATAISEALSALLCALYVWWKVPLLRMGTRHLCIHKPLLRRTLGYSWATALQQTSLYIGKLLVQSCVNGLGVDTIATFNAVNRIDDFAYTPQQNIAHAMTTFIAQNRGAGKYGRIRRGFRAGFVLEAGYWVLLALVVFPAAPWLMRLFVGDDAGVVRLGTSYLHMMAVLYILPAITNWIQGYFRGMGNMSITVISTTVQMIGRVGFTFLFAPGMGITGVAWACLGGWLCMLAYETPYLVRALRETGKTDAAGA